MQTPAPISSGYRLREGEAGVVVDAKVQVVRASPQTKLAAVRALTARRSDVNRSGPALSTQSGTAVDQP